MKTSAKKTSGLKTIAEQLGLRFKAIRTKSPKAASGSSTAERPVNEYYNLANESLTLVHEERYLVNEFQTVVREY